VRFLGFNFDIHLPPIAKAGGVCFYNALLVLNKGLTALLGRRNGAKRRAQRIGKHVGKERARSGQARPQQNPK
jgi:hypothetical protein